MSTNEIPKWAQIEKKDGIQWHGAPVTCRADGALGCFWRGTEITQESLKVVLFGYRWVREKRWTFERQYWLDVAAILDNSVVIISFKKDGASNIFTWLQDTLNAGIDYSLYEIAIVMEQRPRHENELFFIPKIESQTMLSQVAYQRIKEFRALGQFDWILLGEVGNE